VTSKDRAFRKINSRLRTLIPWLHHFLRYARCSVSHPLLRTPPTRLRNSRKPSRRRAYAQTVLGVRRPRTAPSVLRRVPERLPQGVLRKGFARDQSLRYFAERSIITDLLHVASYNVHRCVGLDGLHHPERIARVIKELGVDILGLQEVALSAVSPDGIHQIEYLARSSGLNVLAGPTVLKGHRRFGNALLTRFDVCASRQIDLSLPGKPPRGALDVDLNCYGRTVRVIVTHLGLGRAERKRQVKNLLEIIGEKRLRPTILLGDMNEWIPRANSLKELRASFTTSPSLRTFPSRLPVLPLDRIFVWPDEAFVRAKVHMSGLARIASDHLPIKGFVMLQ